MPGELAIRVPVVEYNKGGDCSPKVLALGDGFISAGDSSISGEFAAGTAEASEM